MKRYRLPSKILLGIIVILSVVTFAFDALEFYSAINIQTWQYIHEALSGAIILLYFLYLYQKPVYSEPDVTKNLKNFVKSLSLLYLVIIISKFSLSPYFTTDTLQSTPADFNSVIHSNIVSLAAIFFLTPMLINLKNLIYFKQKKRTNLYATIALITALLSAVLSIILQTSLDIMSFDGPALYSNFALSISLLFLLILSTRNSWVTYLSAKEKYTYFIGSAVLIWVIIALFDFGFVKAVIAHSHAIGAFVSISWFFLVFYSIMTGLNLLRHLPTAREFDRKMKEVSSLHNLSRAISVEYDMDKLAKMVTDMSSDVLGSSYTWLEIHNGSYENARVAASKNLNIEEIGAINKKHIEEITNQIINLRQSLVLNDISKSEFNRAIKDWKSNINSYAAVPLKDSNGDVLGVLSAAKTTTYGFDPDDINMLEAYANQAAIAFENAKLLKSSFERERMERELQIAREVQLRLLPQNPPQIKDIQIEALTITAYEVGGDYYDFFEHNPTNFSLIIGDVSGKGTSAAFYMAETKGIVQSMVKIYRSPKEMLINANSILYSSMEKKSFISMLTAQFDLKSNILKFARAGHCPVIYFRASDNTFNLLQPGGIAVGLDNGGIFDKSLEEYDLQCEKGDILAFYTDGLSEARNEKDEEFGDEQLGRIIKENAQLEAKQLKDVILDEILKFLNGQSLHDDLTLVMIKI